MKINLQPIAFRNKITVTHLYSAFIQSFKKDFLFTGEKHNFFEFGYILDGTLRVTNEDKVYLCEKGDFFVHPSNSFHACYNVKNAVSFTISFACEGLAVSPGKIHLNEQTQQVMELLIQEIKTCFSQSNGEFYYTDIRNDLYYHTHGYQKIKNYLEILCLYVLENNQLSTQNKENDPDAIKYSNIINYLKENVCQPLTIDDVAKALFVSPANLKRIFHKFVNLGIISYHNDLRIEHAIKLMKENKSISEISSIMNFSSQNYFSYFFKKHTGLAPSQYLKNSAD